MGNKDSGSKRKLSDFSLVKLIDLYSFLLDLDGEKTTYAEVSEKVGIKHGKTIRRYFDLIEILFHVTIDTATSGSDRGTSMKSDGNIILSVLEEDALMSVVRDKRCSKKIRIMCYSILWRLGNHKHIEADVKRIYENLTRIK